MVDEGVPASLLAEAARAAQVRDALQAERQENATLLSACEDQTEIQTKEALRVLLVEAKAVIDQLEKDLEEAMALLKIQAGQTKADGGAAVT
jgi:hypothetical protein